MNLGLQYALENINISLETGVLLIFLFGSIIFFARGFLIGTVMLFFGSSLIFMWFYTAELNYSDIVVVFFISLIMLTLSLYGVSRVSNEVGVI